MLFYADKLRDVDLKETRDRVVSVLRVAAAAYRRSQDPADSVALETHPDLVGAAIALGELHQAAADFLNPSRDEALPDLGLLTAAGLLVGRCVYRSALLSGGVRASAGHRSPGPVGQRSCPLPPGASGSDPAGDEPPPCQSRLGEVGMAELLEAAAKAVAGSLPAGLPPGLRARVPEGYAFYTLYPEMYMASIAKVLRTQSRCSYVVLGIRSIGVSLATMIGGALVEMGIPATVETLRPRGHPFDRYIEMGPELRGRLEACARSDAGFVVVDEGPGLTCSSFLSVCSALDSIGVEEERIAILAAWQGRPSIYASEEARARWRRLSVFYTGAGEAFDGWSRLVPFVRRELGADISGNGHGPGAIPKVQDLSYGRWREHCYGSPDLWPAVHRATERTKLLFDFGPLTPTLSHGERESLVLAKFAGLGDYGREKLERAMTLAGAGFSPPALGLAYGFLLHPFVPGRPMASSDLSPELLDRMVDYYAFVARRFPALPAPSFDRLAEMILVNVRESLGIDAWPFVQSWEARRETIDALPLAQVDGKPQPYEWLEVSRGDGTMFLKTDSADHFHDHTCVGEQSILWDLAGACEEWEMDETDVSLLLGLWERRVGDRLAASLLGYYRAAYLAFRVAALHYAVHSTDEEDIRRSLEHEEWKCRHRLGESIAAIVPD